MRQFQWSGDVSLGSLLEGLICGITVMFGVSIPAVTTRLEMTKQDIRNGRKTGSPVSACR